MKHIIRFYVLTLFCGIIVASGAPISVYALKRQHQAR